MLPKYNADHLDFTRALREYQRTAGLSLREAMRDEWRLGMQTLQRFTPPRTAKQGRIRVSADISRVVRGFNVKSFRNKRLEDIVARRDFAAFDAVMEHVANSELKGAKAIAWNPSLHARSRDRRGRVRRRPTKNFVLGADVERLREYRQRKQGNVGIARAGWTSAVLVAGAKSPAKWIRRHGERFGGARIEHANTDRETLVAFNRTPWANRKDEGQRQIDRMYRQRAKSIERKTEIVRRAGARAGFDVVG